MPSERDNSVEAILTAFLHQHGRRLTRPRQRVLAAINGLPARFTADDVVQLVSRHAGRATAYRTLYELVDARLLDYSSAQYVKRGFG